LKTTIYYKGYLKSQFSTTKGEKLGNSVDMQSKYILEPRFRLYDAVEISEEEFPTYNDYKSKPFLLHEKRSEVEYYFSNAKENDRRIKTELILLLLQKDEKPFFTEGDKNKLNTWNHYFPEEKAHSFLAFKDGIYHGKIEGVGYCKVEKEIEEDGVNMPPVQTLSKNTGCLGPLFATIFGFTSWLKNRLNSLSILVFNKKLINDSPVNPGCLSPILPLGSTSSGCGNLGCGCLPFLLALAFLGWLIWCVILGNCDKSKQQQMEQTKIIHDTVFVEVYKEKVDTLTIVKIDTLTYVDKTTKTNYEMISLQNVQFKTNEDVLLPSSAKELQKLAEYLMKNEDMTAEIIGHTDNVGKPASNKLLSKQRAESIKRFLISLGINGARLNAVGMGDTQPKTANDTEEGRMMNRRVEVKLSKTEKIETKREEVDNKTQKIN
jgi:outer membrane protein OmpA-like peptidoglycan-associated protein